MPMLIQSSRRQSFLQAIESHQCITALITTYDICGHLYAMKHYVLSLFSALCQQGGCDYYGINAQRFYLMSCIHQPMSVLV